MLIVCGTPRSSSSCRPAPRGPVPGDVVPFVPDEPFVPGVPFVDRAVPNPAAVTVSTFSSAAFAAWNSMLAPAATFGRAPPVRALFRANDAIDIIFLTQPKEKNHRQGSNRETYRAGTGKK